MRRWNFSAASPAKIALVILDFAMPGMDGAEAAARLLELRPGLPILVTSGFAATDVARRFASTPVAGYVRKPFTTSTLLKTRGGSAGIGAGGQGPGRRTVQG